MNKTFGLLFYPKKSKVDEQGNAPIYLRITIDGSRVELSTKRVAPVDKWNNQAQRLDGRTENTRELNSYLDVLTMDVYRNHKELIQEEGTITAAILKNRILGIDAKERTLITLFTQHNKRVEKLVGQEFAPGTLERYKTVKKHLEDFLKADYKLNDIPLKKINHQFILDFEYYLKTTRSCGHNSTLKYIKNFKKIVRIAMANGWITTDPFLNYKVRLDVVNREYLTKEEIETMLNKDLHTPRLSQVRDIFIFCCFTGLAYSDVKKLTSNNLVMGIDGERWIKVNRTKTDTRSSIPLLPTALDIIAKYKDHPEVIIKEVLLPVLSNQKSNAYLKEIAVLCNINKNLTTHLARHTFATTVTLTNGVPIESVSKMLGHSSIRSTQHYAKIIDRKVSDDMLALKNKLHNIEHQKKDLKKAK